MADILPCLFDFFEIRVHRDARARACARARPRESSLTMHRVLVHRGARPRESSPTMHGVLVHHGACPRESSPIMAPGDYTR